MANRTFFDVQSSNREVKIIATKVVITGGTSADPNAKAVLTDSDGNDIVTNGIAKAEFGGTAGLTNAGFKITLDDKYEALLSCHVTKGNDDTGGTPIGVQEILEDVSGAKTVSVTCDANLQLNETYYVTMFLLNTSVTR